MIFYCGSRGRRFLEIGSHLMPNSNSLAVFVDDEAHQDAPVATHPSSARILIVDDDARNVRLMEILLKAEGYQVEMATSGEQGLAAVAGRKPDGVPEMELIVAGAFAHFGAMQAGSRERVFNRLPQGLRISLNHVRRAKNRAVDSENYDVIV